MALRIRQVAAAGLIALGMLSPAQAQTVAVGKRPSDDAIALAPGAVDAAIAQLPRIVADVMRRSRVPGMAVAVVRGDRLAYAEAFGVRDLATRAPVTPATVFQIASVSKPLATTVAAIAVARGQVRWTDPVQRHLPRFVLSDPYVSGHGTIGDFLAHRSGLPQAAGDDLEDLGFDRATILARLVHQPLDAFRASYHYANFGTTIAAEAVAAAAGLPWEDLAERTLFGPLRMTQTSYCHADFALRDDAATLHALEDGAFVARQRRNADAQAPAGGASSNVLDLSRWLRLLLGGGSFDGQTLFAEADILPALRPQALSSPGGTLASRSNSYGFGFALEVATDGRVQFAHSGAFLTGGATVVRIVPALGLGIVVLSNGAPVGAVEAIVAEFHDHVLAGGATRDWYAGYHQALAGMLAPAGDLAGAARPVAPRPPPATLAAYAGTYENTYFGPARVTVEDGRLVLRLGPGAGQAFPLEPWDGDRFAMAPRSENAGFGSRSSVVFAHDGGRPASLVVAYLDGTGLATWRR